MADDKLDVVIVGGGLAGLSGAYCLAEAGRQVIVLERGDAPGTCDEKPCICVCPGHLYSRSEETGEMVVEYAGCLECGTCLVACVPGSTLWVYPEGGFGVQYRYG